MRIFIVGAKAQAWLCYNILSQQGHTAPVVYDQNCALEPRWQCRLLSDASQFDEAALTCDGYLICIGGKDGKTRTEYAQRLDALGLEPFSAIHASAVIGRDVELGKGVQVMAGAVVVDGSRVGRQCIINTNASVDHDAKIGEGVHIMGAAALAGNVTVEDFATVGTNATVLPDLTVGRGSFVGAGAVVTRDVAPGIVVAGVPARILRSR